MSARARAACLLFSVLATAGCHSPATQLLVAVDTDFDVPGELGFVRAVVRDAEGVVISSLVRELIEDGRSPGSMQAVAPFSFAVVPLDGDVKRRVIVEIEGRRSAGGPLLIMRRAVTGFIEERTLLLSMFLAKRCEDEWMTCGAGRTCGENGCESDERPPESLPTVAPGDELAIFGDAGLAPDAGPPPPDTGVVPDAGIEPDSGRPPDCGVFEEPRLVHRFNLGHEADKSMVIADVDHDGLAELIVSRGGLEDSAFSVIDLGACASPVVTSTSLPGELRQEPVVVRREDDETELWAGERRAVRAWRYQRSALVHLGTVLDVEDFASMSVAPDSSAAMVVARRPSSEWGYAGIAGEENRVTFGLTNDRVRSALAWVAAPNLFAGGGELSVQLMQPGQATRSLLSLQRGEDPVVVSGARAFGPGFEHLSVIALYLDARLYTLTVDHQAGTSTATSVLLPARIVHETVPIEVAGAVRLALLLEDGTLTWCELSNAPPAPACVPASAGEAFSLPDDQLGGDAALFTAYVDEDNQADLVLVTRTGAVHFLDGARIRDEAASTLMLGRDLRRSGGIAIGFFDGPGPGADLLAVQHPAGGVSLVAWPRPQNPGPTSRLWPQHRRDAQRTASFR